MQTRRWTNPSQPQTLQIAVILFYISAVFSILLPPPFISYLLSLALGVAFGFAGYGIANDRKWGYNLGVAASGIRLAFLVAIPLALDFTLIFNPSFLLVALFPVALFALLLHPMSRNYQRIWFS